MPISRHHHLHMQRGSFDLMLNTHRMSSRTGTSILMIRPWLWHTEEFNMQNHASTHTGDCLGPCRPAQCLDHACAHVWGLPWSAAHHSKVSVLLQASVGAYLESPKLSQNVHGNSILLVLGHGRGVRPDLIHHAQDVALSSILLKVLVVMQLIDRLHSRNCTCGKASAGNPLLLLDTSTNPS